MTYMMSVLKRNPAAEMFLDMREEERLREDGYMDSSFDDEDEGWDCLFSAESLVDQMDRLNDIADDLDCDFVYDLD